MMHDWVISILKIDWGESVIDITFKTSSGDKRIIAREFVELIMPKRESWGSSASVYNVDNPVLLKNNNSKVSIEMQSGDIITIEAKQIVLPCELAGNGQ